MRLRYKEWAIPELEENELIYLSPKENKGKWKEIFGNDNEIELEIGGGYGAFIVEKAKREPNKNFICLEMDSNVFVYAARDFKDSEMKNIRGVRALAQNAPQYFDEDEISKIYINFCNPWPKKRQHKRRLTHPRFLNMYKYYLKKGGEIEFKTDDREFFIDSLEYFKEMGYEILDYSYDLTMDEKPDNIITEYEEKWRSKNIPINYCHVKLVDDSREEIKEQFDKGNKW
ncbi:MAG: tRNA (guanosine(46)-N7)-methyltransferase TrmB [Helcococcus sp.]|nr:tRNA (guanosine(46)-N7)-methyltransferase TrmB [Helcococcus sp.]